MLGRLTTTVRGRLPQAVSSPRAAIDTAIATSPLGPVRLFWNSLREMEEWWPVLLPILVWVFWRTYQRERAELAATGKQS